MYINLYVSIHTHIHIPLYVYIYVCIYISLQKYKGVPHTAPEASQSPTRQGGVLVAPELRQGDDDDDLEPADDGHLSFRNTSIYLHMYIDICISLHIYIYVYISVCICIYLSLDPACSVTPGRKEYTIKPRTTKSKSMPLSSLGYDNLNSIP